MNDFKKIIIDEDNYKYLVRKELPYYAVSLNYGIPKRTKKGYLGCKHQSNNIKIKNREGAQQLFANWKEEYISKFMKKEIISLYVSYRPVYFYYVTCPYCGKNAEIQDFIMLMGTDIDECFPIVCRQCNGTPDEIYSWITVGECLSNAIDKTNEEQKITIQLAYKNDNIKYDDFIKNPDILKRS